MKIVMFGQKRVPSREGGVEIVVEELSARMVKLGHQVTCLNRGGHHVSGARYDASPKENHRGVSLRTVPTIDAKGLAAVSSSAFAAIYSAFSDADVVHIHAEGPAFMCWIPKLFNKRVIVSVHGLDWRREKWKNSFGSKYIHMGERAAVCHADEIIVLSRNVQEYFLREYNRKTVYIPNGVSRAEPVEANVIRNEYGLEKDGYILFLGRLVPEKGVHYLIEAYRQINTDKKLVIAGGGSDSQGYEKQLSALAESSENIIFTGFVHGKKLEELYSNAYIYVLPSDVEGMPLSLLEAMSYGNCCLVSDIPECMEVVEDKALSFRAGDTDSLQKRLETLCADPALVSKYKKSAQEHVCGKYNWDEVTEKTLELY